MTHFARKSCFNETFFSDFQTLMNFNFQGKDDSMANLSALVSHHSIPWDPSKMIRRFFPWFFLWRKNVGQSGIGQTDLYFLGESSVGQIYSLPFVNSTLRLHSGLICVKKLQLLSNSRHIFRPFWGAIQKDTDIHFWVQSKGLRKDSNLQCSIHLKTHLWAIKHVRCCTHSLTL